MKIKVENRCSRVRPTYRVRGACRCGLRCTEVVHVDIKAFVVECQLLVEPPVSIRSRSLQWPASAFLHRDEDSHHEATGGVHGPQGRPDRVCILRMGLTQLMHAVTWACEQN